MLRSETTMTSNRAKAAARLLQAEQNLPYAEALRRVTNTPASARRRQLVEHKCVGGLWLTDHDGRRKVCALCATEAEKARVAAVDQAARDLTVLGQATSVMSAWWGSGWPYGPNIDLDSREALVAWAGPLGLRASSTSRSCLHWIQRKQCPRTRDYSCAAVMPGNDHVTAWNQGAGRNPAVLVSQPYGLDDESHELLAQINTSPDLTVEINEQGGWYGHGTVFVAIWRADRRPMPAQP